MQPHERVGLEPVAADTVAAVDEGDAHVGVVDQRVGERHAHGPGADHQVVGLDCARHGATKAQARRLRTPRRVVGPRRDRRRGTAQAHGSQVRAYRDVVTDPQPERP